MVRRSTWYVIAILIILISAVYLWQKYGKAEESATPMPTTESLSLLLNLVDQSILSFIINDSSGYSMSFELDPGDNTWLVSEQAKELADSQRIESIVSSLTFMVIDSELTTQPPLDAMGLDQPTYQITLNLDNGDQIEIHVGNITPTGSGYYVRVDENPAVVIDKIEMDAVINLLSSPPLASTYTPTPTSTATITATITPTATNTFTRTIEVTPQVETTGSPTP